MSKNKQAACLICAWRANCVKRFTMGKDETLFCPDFTEDLTLKKTPAASGTDESGAGDEQD
ncbi:hypothetical protein EDC39_11828 [Geothermobacter ehrlichii]|uniref:Uncharacterized protein n=1 Tax=Geothermobacter ehrlichii TaxID=213224 RepID=A0A5D3WJ56_9BACT|nr:hypothetical protein [Geothermobacter ehrlichii]TYO95688.1 hypothetical protein EDC39_11828 [Geothermobacter ehrlichii]